MLRIGSRLLTLLLFGAMASPWGWAGEIPRPGSIEFQLKCSLANRSIYSLDVKKNLPPGPDEFAPSGQQKSPSQALLLSLLLPGAGQFYNESKTKAGVFAGTEASLWLGFFTFRTIGSWKKTDYQNYAVAHAGVNPEDKDDDFYERLTFYDDRDQYNQLTRLYNGPEAPIYPEIEFWNWEWDGFNSRSKYRDLRNQSKTAYRRSLYMVGLAGLNRILSALDAFRGAKNFNRQKALEREELSFHPKISLFGSNRKVGLVATKSFY